MPQLKQYPIKYSEFWVRLMTSQFIPVNSFTGDKLNVSHAIISFTSYFIMNECIHGGNFAHIIIARYW